MKTPPCIKSIFIAALSLWFGGCGTPSRLEDLAVNTPAVFSENRVFYVKGATKDQIKSELVQIYQSEPEAGDAVEPNSPLAVILRGVRIPDVPEFKEPRAVAVILDIVTADTGKQVPIVAFYQRGVRGGQVLNFSNMVVFADSRWDETYAPYFRVRLIDVATEKNEMMLEMLKDAEGLAGSLSGVVPTLSVPGVALAARTAQFILQRGSINKTMMDFQVQFFSASVLKQSGKSALGLLRRGEWIVVGRSVEQGPGFWTKPLYVQRQSEQIVDANDHAVEVPYVMTSITTADLQVPALVMARSQKLADIISGRGTSADIGTLESTGKLVDQALKSFTVLRAFTRTKDMASFAGVVVTLDKLSRVDQVSSGDPSIAALMEVVHAVVLDDTTLNGPSEVATWWNNKGKQGRLVKNADTRYGVKWESATTTNPTTTTTNTTAPATTPATAPATPAPAAPAPATPAPATPTPAPN